ncbi:MAG: alpha/beta hydrolase [Acidimicrobiales bacterium]|jgi:pimeloyl-ACP methyl ester carboxylesterase
MAAPASLVRDATLVQVRGYELRVRVEGTGPALLLLNGLTRPLESWDPFVKAVSGRTVVRFDVPGVGGNPASLLPHSIAKMAEITALVLDEIGLDRVDVLGYSHGGAVAQEFSVRYPKRVRNLVLVSTSCGVGSTLGSWSALSSLRSVTDIASWSGLVGALWHSMAISNWTSIPFLGSITAPTLVVCGRDDVVVPPANSRALAQRIANATLVLLEGGHDLQGTESAQALARCVENFLRQPHTTEKEAFDHDRTAL